MWEKFYLCFILSQLLKKLPVDCWASTLVYSFPKSFTYKYIFTKAFLMIVTLTLSIFSIPRWKLHVDCKRNSNAKMFGWASLRNIDWNIFFPEIKPCPYNHSLLVHVVVSTSNCLLIGLDLTSYAYMYKCAHCLCKENTLQHDV